MLAESARVTESIEQEEDALLLAPSLSRGNSQTEATNPAGVVSASRLMGSDDLSSVATEPEITAPESDSTYNTELREYRFGSCHFDSEYTCPEGLNVARVNKELKTLSRDLPCESTAAIYARTHADCLSYFRTLISGAVDSPYAYGLYLFEVTLPQTYPIDPPSMQILTTGNGQVRFNPNLYADGYMCLSILNTWSSSPEEMWNPALSSLLQVFVSIQSLVMDENVIQKEPGYEDYETDSTANKLYRDIVRYNNMKWAMTDMINNPPQGFEVVVKTHFRLLREKILELTNQWVAETEIDNPEDNEGLISSHNPGTLGEFSSSGRKACMQAAFSELHTALESLH